MLIAALLAVAALGSTGDVSAEDTICKLNLQKQLEPHDEPLILKVNQIRDKKEQLEIARPEVEYIDGAPQGVIHISANKKLLVACTGSRNTNAASHKETVYAECTDGQLMIEGEAADKDSLSCTGGVAKSWLQNTKETCGNGDNVGTKLELGFMLTDKKPDTFFPFVDVCHNIEEMNTYYSAHSLYGGSLRGAVKSSERRRFSPGPKGMGLFKGVDPEKLYSQNGQKEALDQILGDGANSMYVNKTVFLARGHLSPDADFIYNSGQLMTYYYINVAPQWQTFNAGNWLQIENTVRSLAAKTNETVLVWTGTHGVLKLKDLQGNEQEIYLVPSKKHIPVPEIYWKLVQHPVTKSCTVAIGHNNVFLTEPPTPICKTVKVDGWPELTSLNKGYVYYCDYDSFKESVSYVPQLECKDTFEFPTLHS